jgi:HAD superfamily hydrolase (TIGR01509 family)
MDGTLLDSMPVWHGLFANYLEDRGIESTPEIAADILPLSLEQIATYFSDRLGLHLTAMEIHNGLMTLATNRYQLLAKPKPYVPEFLEQCHRRGVTMGVATVTDKSLAESLLARFDLLPYFQGVWTCDTIGLAKSKPEFYHKVAALLGHTAADTAVFEDAPYCVRSAREGGFTVFAVHDLDALESEARQHAHHYLLSFAELMA